MTDSSTKSDVWYAEGLCFSCTRCGNCCSGAPGYVWVSPEERQQIAAHLGVSQDDFDLRHTRKVGWRTSLLERPDGDCEFLERYDDGTTGCRIHSVRPTQCRTWPFWKSNLGSPRAWNAAAKGCPGMSTGRSHSLPVIQAALRANGKLPL